MASEWTPEATKAINLCQNWAEDIMKSANCSVYLFGSAIYDGGDQFNPQNSDLDLIVLFHDKLDATARALSIEQLLKKKAALELNMIPELHRINCQESGASVVPLTSVELQTNIHKSGVRRFFSRNIFLDLRTMEQTIALEGAGTSTLSEEARHALEYAQKMRNLFLDVSANGINSMAPFDGTDPIPKSAARVAAQLIPDSEEGAWYDTRFGLDYIFTELANRRTDSEQIKSLHRTISVRRGGRGQRRPLTAFDQLLLAEIIYDLAAAAPLEPVATWDIRFRGVESSVDTVGSLISELKRLVPDANIIGTSSGSVIIRLRSSSGSYDTVRKLYDAGALPKFFGVSAVEISAFGAAKDQPGFKNNNLLQRAVNAIQEWTLPENSNPRETEANLTSFLQKWLYDQPGLAGSTIKQNTLIGHRSKVFRPDILINSTSAEKDETVIIEVVMLHTRWMFFRKIEQMLQLSMPTILVVIGHPEILQNLQAEFDKIQDLDSGIYIIGIPTLK